MLKAFSVMFTCVFVVRTTIEIKGVHIIFGIKYRGGAKTNLLFCLFLSPKGVEGGGGGPLKNRVFFISLRMNSKYKTK